MSVCIICCIQCSHCHKVELSMFEYIRINKKTAAAVVIAFIER